VHDIKFAYYIHLIDISGNNDTAFNGLLYFVLVLWSL